MDSVEKFSWVLHSLSAIGTFAVGFAIGSALDVTSYTFYRHFSKKGSKVLMAVVVAVQLFAYFSLFMLFDRLAGRTTIEAYAAHLGLLLSQVFIFVEFLSSLTKKYKPPIL